jgi:hypothetical protein
VYNKVDNPRKEARTMRARRRATLYIDKAGQQIDVRPAPLQTHAIILCLPPIGTPRRRQS